MGRRQTIDPLVRAKVIDTWGNDCWLGLPGCTKVGAEDDHIVPYSHGGMDTVANIRRACKHCNASRQDRVLYGYGARLHMVIVPPGSCDREAVEWIDAHKSAGDPVVSFSTLATAMGLTNPSLAAGSRTTRPTRRNSAPSAAIPLTMGISWDEAPALDLSGGHAGRTHSFREL